jgi:hypothetical protein
VTWKLQHLLPAERLALGIFAALITTSVLGAVLYRNFWILGSALVALVWVVAVLLALFNVLFAARDSGVSPSTRLRSAIAIPLALAAAYTLQFRVGIGPRAAASVHLAMHADQMRSAPLAAAPGRAASLRYLEGVPDGGSAIVTSRTDPTKLSTSEQLRLTGERIEDCLAIVGGYLCSFD